MAHMPTLRSPHPSHPQAVQQPCSPHDCPANLAHVPHPVSHTRHTRRLFGKICTTAQQIVHAYMYEQPCMPVPRLTQDSLPTTPPPSVCPPCMVVCGCLRVLAHLTGVYEHAPDRCSTHLPPAHAPSTAPAPPLLSCMHLPQQHCTCPPPSLMHAPSTATLHLPPPFSHACTFHSNTAPAPPLLSCMHLPQQHCTCPPPLSCTHFPQQHCTRLPPHLAHCRPPSPHVHPPYRHPNRPSFMHILHTLFPTPSTPCSQHRPHLQTAARC